MKEGYVMLYHSRAEAGEIVARELVKYQGKEVYVLTLPRGGVVVGYQIARSLDAPLDVMVARKLGAPGRPEFGFGAIAWGGAAYFNPDSVRMLALTEEQISAIVWNETIEMERRNRLYRGDRPWPNLRKKNVILVDDGLATGVTARAAIKAIRTSSPARLALAVPVAPAQIEGIFRALVDDFVCPYLTKDFFALSQYYEDFSQATDEEVIELLHKRREEMDCPCHK
jgi:putative phosphoribosyl transferase